MAIFTAIIAAVGTLISSFTTANIAAFLVNTFAKAATSMLVSAILGQNKKSPAFGIQGKLQAGENTPRGFGVGKFCTAGSLVYANEWGKAGKTPNAYLTMVIALSDIPVTSLTRLMVNGAWVTLSGTPDPDGKGYPVNAYSLNMWVKFYDGTQTSADTFLTGTVASTARPYESTRVGYGVAYVIVTTKWEKTLFSGFPTFKFEVEGVPLYDPSKDTTVGGSGSQRWGTPSTWVSSNNPVVQAYNIQRGISLDGTWQFGFQGVTEGRMPVADWITQINKCNENVWNGTANEKRYRSAGFLTYDTECGTALESIMAACGGRIADIGGIYKPMVGYVPASVASITDGDILSTEDAPFYPVKGLADTVNAVMAQYPSPEDGYAMKDAAPVYRADLETIDQGRRLPAQVTLGNVPYPFQVQRLMSLVIEEARRTRRHTITLGPAFWTLEPNDIITWASDRHGYSSKTFRVNAVMDLPTSEVVVDLIEIDEADYDFDSGGYSAFTASKLTTPPALVPPDANTLGSWNVTATTVKDNAGADRLPALLLEWDTEDLVDVSAISFVVETGAGVRVAVGTITDVAEGSAIVSEGILGGEDYKAKAYPHSDSETAWTSFVTATTALDTLGALVGVYAAKSAAYTVVTGDRGKVLSCTGTWTLSLPAAATAAAGFSVLAHNASTGIITIDPSGSETVGGATTAELRPGHGMILMCTGTAWVTLALPRAQARAADIAMSEPSNLFPDFDMVDEAFYTSSTGGTIQFAASATTTIGARYAYFAANASAHSMESDWFAVEPSTEYLVSAYCTLSTATAGSGTMTVSIETGSLDDSGVVTSLGSTTVGTRTDVFNATPFTVSVTTGSTARRARFVGLRAAGGTAQGRMAGLKVQKKTTQAMLATGAVTTSTTDDTTGRLARIGDFGLGRVISLTGSTLLKDRVLRPGLYTYNTGTITDGPETSSWAHALWVGQTTSAQTGSDQRRGVLSLRLTGSGNHRLFVGSQGSDEATPGAFVWSQLYGQRGILATVTQSGGVPTGGLIERGSNANGEYVRFADGLLICTHSMAASSGAAATWTFPSAFTAAPKVTGDAIATVLSAVCLDAAPSTTAATFSARDKTDARRADTCHLIAVGRWF